MFHLCNNGKPRTEISEYNGSNIKTIDDNLLPGLLVYWFTTQQNFHGL